MPSQYDTFNIVVVVVAGFQAQMWLDSQHAQGSGGSSSGSGGSSSAGGGGGGPSKEEIESMRAGTYHYHEAVSLAVSRSSMCWKFE